MTKNITVLVCVRNGEVNGLSAEGEYDLFQEWLSDPTTEMIVRVDLEVGKKMLFKSKAELLAAIGGAS